MEDPRLQSPSALPGPPEEMARQVEPGGLKRQPRGPAASRPPHTPSPERLSAARGAGPGDLGEARPGNGAREVASSLPSTDGRKDRWTDGQACRGSTSFEGKVSCPPRLPVPTQAFRRAVLVP